jgi:hypothetical protein
LSAVSEEDVMLPLSYVTVRVLQQEREREITELGRRSVHRAASVPEGAATTKARRRRWTGPAPWIPVITTG